MNWLAKWTWITLCATVAITTSAQTLTTLAAFHRRNGDYPEASLMQGSDGNLYGTLATGGVHGGGAVFKVSLAGEKTVLHNFCAKPNCVDGAEPYAGLIEGTDGNFYGTTLAGGTGYCSDGVVPGCGTVFRISSRGKLTTLYSICTLQNCMDGAQPLGALVQAANGKFYGTTCGGGVHNRGTVFLITAQGKFRRRRSFNGADGDCPAARDALVLSTDGNFYGTTATGGAHNGGTVFKITPQGKLTTLYSFCAIWTCADGQDPISGLILATNGSLYGITSAGGLYNEGTVFKITRWGKFETIHSFCDLNCLDGNFPTGRLIQASDGQLYGTASNGGANGLGTIFKITLAGRLTTLLSFCGLCGEGGLPWAGLVQASDGRFYGTTTSGAARGEFATVFSFIASSGD